MKPKIAIIMGSKSDLPTMKKATDILEKLCIPYSMRIYSAHRTPNALSSHIDDINSCDECKVIITGAGMSAALSGCVAAQTIKPVIGVPLSGSKLDGMDALLSTVQMPPGIPVLSVGIDAAKNAALAAASILALSDPEIASMIKTFRELQTHDVIFTDANIDIHDEAISSMKFKCEF